MIIDTSGFSIATLAPVTPEQAKKLPAALAAEDQAFSGTVSWYARERSASFTIVLLELAKGEIVLYVDLDSDGKFSAEEAFSLPGGKPEAGGDFRLKIPFKMGPYTHYPFLVRRFARGMGPSQPAGKRVLGYTFQAFAQGAVDIDGRSILTQYSVNPDTKTVNVTKGWLKVDCNGNGIIDMGAWSPEADFARDETVVFRVGDRYVSTESVDLETGRIVLKDHPATDYKRIELALGLELPDFPFVDLEGKPHKLSDYRGKYVLLDFWGTWCGPCVWEIPHLKAAYTKYQSRGFEILGMDTEHDPGKIRPFVQEKGIAWTQATTESIEELVKTKFRVQSWPREILLDPKGRILSAGMRDHLPLTGERLMATLDKIFAAK